MIPFWNFDLLFIFSLCYIFTVYFAGLCYIFFKGATVVRKKESNFFHLLMQAVFLDSKGIVNMMFHEVSIEQWLIENVFSPLTHISFSKKMNKTQGLINKGLMSCSVWSAIFLSKQACTDPFSVRSSWQADSLRFAGDLRVSLWQRHK